VRASPGRAARRVPRSRRRRVAGVAVGRVPCIPRQTTGGLDRGRVLRLHPRTDRPRAERDRASSSHALPCDVVLSGDPLPGAHAPDRLLTGGGRPGATRSGRRGSNTQPPRWARRRASACPSPWGVRNIARSPASPQSDHRPGTGFVAAPPAPWSLPEALGRGKAASRLRVPNCRCAKESVGVAQVLRKLARQQPRASVPGRCGRDSRPRADALFAEQPVARERAACSNRVRGGSLGRELCWDHSEHEHRPRRLRVTIQA